MTDPRFRIYGPDDPFDASGYPLAWQDLKHLVREEAGHRCRRCLHPYHVGEHDGRGMWTDCDELCSHQDNAPVRVLLNGELVGFYRAYNGGLDTARADWWDDPFDRFPEAVIQAKWRILTVHHLNGVKGDCRWWNLVALCQRCHLAIQGKVKLDRPWPWPHSDWFQPNVAAFYALKYLAEDLSREETMERLVELLALGREEEAVERLPL